MHTHLGFHQIKATIRIAIVVLALLPAESQAQSFDVLLRGGSILDGSGMSAVRADLAIRDGRIAVIGLIEGGTATTVIDATNLIITPGFIDLHSHADGSKASGGLRSRNPERRAALNLVSQGITTVTVNPDGRSPYSIAEQRRELEATDFGPNVVLMAGHNTIRSQVMRASHERIANDEEIAAMRKLVAEAMKAGAFGMTAGLEYIPGRWSNTEEVVELAKEIAPYGGSYIVHERASGVDPMWFVPSQDNSNPPNMIDNIRELIEVSDRTGITVVATHIKARGTDFWGSGEEMVSLINKARERGVPIFADQYPYTTSGSDGRCVLIPSWIRHDETDGNGKRLDHAEALTSALADPQLVDLVRGDIAHEMRRRGGPENIVVMEYINEDYVGKDLFTLACDRELSPVDFAIALQLEGDPDRPGGAQLRSYSMSEEDVERFAAEPWTATASDADITLQTDGRVHARFYGTFPRKIRRYALDRGTLTVEQAVRSMTSLPADILGLPSRGLIRVGHHADIAVLNLETIRDTATFFEPHQYAEGIEHVFIGGTAVVADGKPTGRRPGQVIVRPDKIDRQVMIAD
jgi:N-acyl-D-amino-acid deacylase